MRWSARGSWLAGLVLFLSGCTQQIFVSKIDYEYYRKHTPLALEENNPSLGTPDLTQKTMTPVTVDRPEEREPWYMSLQEAIAISLENGSTGILSVRQPGVIPDDLLPIGQLTGIEQASDSIQVLTYNPAVSGSRIETSLSRFDTKWVNSMGWNYVDEQIQGLGSFQNGSSALLSSSLVKQLGSGGVSGITFSTQYTDLATPPTGFPIQNPAYLSRFDLVYEQPLFKDFGGAINQLLPRPPGSSIAGQLLGQNFGPAQSYLNSHYAGLAGGTESILVSRLRFDQSRAEFERIMNYRLLNVEVAYWNLYGAYVTLYAAEGGLKLARKTWEVNKNRFDLGKGEDKEGQDSTVQEPQSRAQYEEFRANRFLALGQVLEFERILRRLLGLPAEDGKQLIPIDPPTVAPYYPDFKTAEIETMTLRPELMAAREELKVRQMNVIVQLNNLKPDLTFGARYGLNGLGSRLDGNGAVFDAANGQFRSDNSFRNLSSGDFTDWNMNLTYNVPLGFRLEHTLIRQSRLQMAQAALAVKNEEEKARAFLTKAYRDLFEKYRTIQARKAQRIASARELEVRASYVQAGLKSPDSFLLDAQRRWANALSQEYQAIVDYNNGLALFQFAKGTIMQHNNVSVAEGRLPECAEIRAVAHQQERSKALVLHERSAPVPHNRLPGLDADVGMPQLSDYEAVALPSLYEGARNLPPAPTPGQVPVTPDTPFPNVLPQPKTTTGNSGAAPLPKGPTSAALPTASLPMAPAAAPMPKAFTSPYSPTPLPGNLPTPFSPTAVELPTAPVFNLDALGKAP